MNFVFISRVMRLVVFTYILLASSFQQVMASSASANKQSRVHHASHLQTTSSPSLKCWKTMEDKSSYHSFIFEPLIFPEWLCIMILYAVATLIANAVMLSARSQFSEQLKTSESKFHSAAEEHKNYKLSIDHRNFLLRRHIQSLIQDISNLKVELDKFRPLASSLVPQRERAASMALGPVSEVPACEYSSPQNLAFMASGPVHQVLACANTPTPKCASMASGPV